MILSYLMKWKMKFAMAKEGVTIFEYWCIYGCKRYSLLEL